MRIYLSLALSCVLLTACRKFDPGPNEGFTQRDEVNQLGVEDKSDWTTDTKWKKIERELFDDLPVEVKGAGSGGYRAMALFPNPISPVHRTATLYTDLRTTGKLRLRLVVVDRRYRKQLENTLEVQPDARGGSMLQLQFPADKFKKDQLYRIYYVFYDDTPALRYKGHGDFVIKGE